MIFDFLIGTLLSAVVTAVTSILPAGSGPFGGIDLSGLLIGYTWLNSFMPVYESLQIMVAASAFLVTLGGSFAALWALRKLHVVG